MRSYQILLVFGLILFLLGCTSDTNTSQTEEADFTKISTKKSEINQSVSNKAKKSLEHHDEIKKINAVNIAKTLVITIEVHHNKRFRLATIRKKIKKELEKEFPDRKVELSTDKKIVIELNRLEKQIRQENISKKKLEKELKQLIKLMNEQT